MLIEKQYGSKGQLKYTETLLSVDITTDFRNRLGMVKVRIEVDLTKPKHRSIWVRQEDTNNPVKGFYQKLEYEGVPKYCKLLGHSNLQCRALEREKELKNKKNAIKKNATISTDNGTKMSKGINVADVNNTLANNIDNTIASTSKV
ncbi:hypothetical protein H5410_036920 [Solanum commersonii]|uniref:DUF4283 domain-containing protein n=1 Tax=Solanum commersonii TaxID=4109 RepID=A0A9J5Y801_SOLCO|nr:hypothetical protein H5410_036920 [Solanum commersonii]